MSQEKIQPKARYFSEEPSHFYTELNGGAFDLSVIQAVASGKTVTSEDETDPTFYNLHANEEGIEEMVKVVPLPVCIPPELSKSSIREMRDLREQGVLTSLRGGRKTDLARPLKPEVRELIKKSYPHLVELITRVEESTQGSDLFIRAIKMDEARASTTQKEEDRNKGNLHFDAERSSLAEYSDPVYQFYANVSRLPRQFQIIPTTLPEMLDKLVLNEKLLEAERLTTPLEKILQLYLENFPITYEQIIIESGHLSIFDGRRFAHDAGKGRMRKVRQGSFEPSHEPDLLIAFDTPKTGYHTGFYDPNQSLLEDPGTDAWWELMNKIT